jgi:glycerophosphoryl diester phosphodiesterase
VPAACRGSLVLLPVNIAPYAWGWPHRLVERLRLAGTSVFVTGSYDGETGASGVDSREEVRRLPAGYSGGIWTNRIDRIAPLTGR